MSAFAARQHDSPRAALFSPRAALFLTLASVLPARDRRPEAADSTPTILVRDSAGVRLVESHAPRLPADSWRISDVASLTIGDERAAMQQLHRVVGAVRLSDGRIAVLVETPPHLRWYDATGTFLAAAGGRGSGPGEFPGGILTHIWRLPDDSVATWEYSQRRMQVFDGAGRYARAVRLTADLGGQPAMVGLLADGSFLVHPVQSHSMAAPGTVARGTLRFVRYAPDGSSFAEIGTFPGMETVRLRTSQPFSYPYAVQPVFAAAGDRFYYGLSEGWSIEVRRADGTLELLTRRPHSPRPLARPEVSSFEDAVVAAESDPERARMVRSTFAEIPWPATAPAFGGMKIDADGNLWVREYSPALTWPAFRNAVADTLLWSVFDPDGAWLTDVRLRGNFELLDIGDSWVLVLSRDGLDVERIQLYPLIRPSPERMTATGASTQNQRRNAATP
jgi:hypothetical protein